MLPRKRPRERLRVALSSVLVFAIALGLSHVSLPSLASVGGTYDLSWFTIDAGDTVAGGPYTIDGSVGQFDASHAQSGGQFELTGGFWTGSRPPVANDDTDTVDEDSVDNPIDLLANDTNAQSISAVGSTDQGGTVLNAGTYVTYTPTADFFGTEVFTYTVTDGHGGFDTATVTVTVTPRADAPVLIAPSNGTITTATSVNLTWQVDPDATGYRVDFNGTVVDVGNVTISNTGVLADGTYTWTVAAYDAVHTSLYTDVWAFTIDTSPQFTLTASSTMTNTPYAQHTYTLTLTNAGSVTDTYDLTSVTTDTSALPACGIPSQCEWQVQLAESNVTLNPNESVDVAAVVLIPANEVQWVTHTLTITVTSQNYGHARPTQFTTSTGGRWDAEDDRWEACRFDVMGTGEVTMTDSMFVYSQRGSTAPADRVYDYFHTGEVTLTDSMLVYQARGRTCAP